MICHLAIDGFGVFAMLRRLIRHGGDRIGLTAALMAAASEQTIAGPDSPVATVKASMNSYYDLAILLDLTPDEAL
jgi:hypothetical protein